MYQTDPPLDPKKFLPTMYALKSEYPQEPGLPREIFCPPNYPEDKIFTGSDLKLNEPPRV